MLVNRASEANEGSVDESGRWRCEVSPVKMNVRTQRLRQSRSYCLERSVEVKDEIACLHEEVLVLKARIGTAPDETTEGRFRSRRRFLSRRLDELTAERLALSQELEDVNDELVILIAGTARDERRHVFAESDSIAPEKHGDTESGRRW